MKSRSQKSSRVIPIILLVGGILLGACSNLAGDVLPPQEMEIKEVRQNTPLPTQTEVPEEISTQGDENTDQTTGEVYVEIIDHTGGDLSAHEIEIRLEGYDEFEKAFEETLTLPEDGLVIFNQVPLLTGRVFFASVPYGGAVYRSAIHQVGPETTEIVLQVGLFETTTDASGIMVDRVHVLVDYLDPEFIQISEIVILSNLGDKTLVAKNPDQPVLAFPLPENATDIQFENGTLGQRFIKTEDGFGDTVSVPPGTGVYQVLVYFRLPFQGTKLDYSQIMNYPVSAVVAMTPAGGLKIKGDFFQDLGLQSIPSEDVQVYSGGGIGKGERLEFRITGSQPSLINKPIAGTLALNPYIIIVGVLGIGLILAGLILLIRNQRTRIGDRDTTFDEDEKNQILDSIIALEDLYNEGEISENDFQRKRQELKDKLEALVQGKH